MKEVVTQLYADDQPTPDVKAVGKHAFERIPILEMAIDLKQCMHEYMGMCLFMMHARAPISFNNSLGWP